VLLLYIQLIYLTVVDYCMRHSAHVSPNLYTSPNFCFNFVDSAVLFSFRSFHDLSGINYSIVFSSFLGRDG